jgi:competence protein ComEA
MKGLWILTVSASLCLAAMADDDAKTLPDGPGKEIVGKACVDCHDAGNFRKKRLTEDQWWEKVGEMVEQGAKANEQEQTAIVAYLVKNFGPDSKVHMNSAPHSELIVVLGFTPTEAQSIVAYRKDYGSFKEWKDVLKVPGVDAGKVEAQKERMVF